MIRLALPRAPLPAYRRGDWSHGDLTVQGIEAHRFIQGVAGKPDDLPDRADVEGLLDELDYLMQVLEPRLQAPAHDLTEGPRARLDDDA